MASKQKILIVDDDTNIAELISLYLKKECFDTAIVNDGAEALQAFQSYSPNLILLDIMLPGMDGYQICREIRKTSNVPIIMLSAKGEIFDKVLGLELGADDYIIKPFDSKELVARVKAVLRRSQPQQVSKLLKVGGLVVNLDEYTVIADGCRVQLTYKEFEILRMFLSHPGMVYTREQLFSQVWKQDYMGDSRTLDAHIRTLRQKLDGYGKMIETVRNVGYRWEVGYDK